MCAKEGAFEAMMIHTAWVIGVKPTVSIHSAIAALFLPYWRRRLSSDLHSILDHSHGTACGASMAMTVPLSRNVCVQSA